MIRSRRLLLLGGAHLAVLWSFAFAQPLFDLLSDNPEFFVARGNERVDILVFAFGLVLLPPVAMLALEAIVERISSSAADALHLILIGILTAALALQLVDDLFGGPGWTLVILALSLGLLGAMAYAWTRFVPALLSVLVPAPLVFLVFFLLLSPVSELVLPQESVEASASEVTSDAPVVLVIFDELPVSSLLDRRGGIDASRYPAFAELAARSTWYRHATAVEWFTTRAVPSILIGGRPAEGALPTASDEPQNLFTELGGDFDLNVWETSTRLCPESLCGRSPVAESFGRRMEDLGSDLSLVSGHLLLPEDLATGLPPVDKTFGDFAAAESGVEPEDDPETTSEGGRGGEFLDFVDSIQAERRTFNFHHAKLPHTPFNYLPSGHAYGEGTLDLLPDRWARSRSPAEQSYQQHLLQVGFADLLLGRLIDRLRELGIWDDALVIVTADHGISFQPGEFRRQPRRPNIADVGGVPLFVKSPNQAAGEVESRHVCTTEVPAMIGAQLDVAGGIDSDPCPLSEVRVGRVEVPFRAFKRRQALTVERLGHLLGPGAGWASVYGMGPHPRLLGAAVARLPEAAGSGAGATINDAERYGDVDPGGGSLPALVEGDLSGVELGRPIAVAVNGRIAGMTRAFEAEGGTRFAAMVPPRAFAAGPNRVEVFAVVGGGRRPGLEPLA